MLRKDAEEAKSLLRESRPLCTSDPGNTYTRVDTTEGAQYANYPHRRRCPQHYRHVTAYAHLRGLRRVDRRRREGGAGAGPGAPPGPGRARLDDAGAEWPRGR